MNTDFQDILNQVATEYEETQVINRWLPPDGDYTAIIEKCETGKSTSQKSTFGWIRLDCRLLCEGNPELDGKEFEIFHTTKLLFKLKPDANILSGGKHDPSQVAAIFKAAEGWIINTTISTNENQKTGQTFRNASITEVVDKADAGKEVDEAKVEAPAS